MSKIQFFIFISFILICCSFHTVTAMFQSCPQNPSRYNQYLNFYKAEKMEGKIRILDFLNRGIQEIDKEIDKIAKGSSNTLKGALEQKKRMYSDALEELVTPRKSEEAFGLLIAQALGGDDSALLFEDNKISGISDGFAKGITARTARVLGDFVAEKIKSTFNQLFGGMWDYAVDTIVKASRNLCLDIFHSSRKPFTQFEIKQWSMLVLSFIDGFSKLIKNRIEFESRSRDMTSRNLDSSSDNKTTQDQMLWEFLSRHYTCQCDYFVFEMENRKQYYTQEDDSFIIFLVSQLQEWLAGLKDLISNTKTLQDVSAQFGSNVILINEVGTNIKKLFEQLFAILQENEYSFGDKTKTNDTTSSIRKPINNFTSPMSTLSGPDNGFPMSFSDKMF